MTGRRNTLDILRLFAALLVVAFHFLFRMQSVGIAPGMTFPDTVAELARHADVGLAIFFMISGYVITMSAEGRSAYDFTVGRIARLWPAFIVSASISAAFLAVAGLPDFRPTLLQWLANLTMVAPAFRQPFIDGAYWSIVYEIVFYAGVAVVVASGQFDRRIVPVAFVWVVLATVNECMFGSTLARHVLLSNYAAFFAIGIGLRRTETDPTHPPRILFWTAVFAAVPLAVVNDLVIVNAYRVGPEPLAAVLVSMISIALVAAAARLPIAERLRIPPGVALAIGGMTYPLYLLHQNIGYSVFAEAAGRLGPWTTFFLLVAGLMVLAWAIWRFVEPIGRRLVWSAAARLRVILREPKAGMPPFRGPDPSVHRALRAPTAAE